MPVTYASPISQDSALARLAAPVAQQLEDTEARLEALVPPQAGELVATVYRHVLKAGGKRLRPLLALLSCQAAGGDAADCVDRAMALEVLHLSSLVHDDVIDEASHRRGKPSVRQRWGNRTSILVGDFLLAEVTRRLSGELEQRSLEVMASAVSDMCLAELAEQPADPADLTEEAYFARIRGKTARLMAAACEVGAIAANCEAARQPLSGYGMALGHAFQITDDLLDLYGDASTLGKPVLQDLGAGQWTLPLIHALRSASPSEAEQLGRLLLKAEGDCAAARRAADLAERLGGRRSAEERSRELTERARGALLDLPDTPARRSLSELADYVARRRS
jgi:geranylgeranyl pyrophosphate synthase